VIIVITYLLRTIEKNVVDNGTFMYTKHGKLVDADGNAEFAGVDKAGVDNSAPYCRVGICRSGQISTMWQVWTLQEWTVRQCTMWQGWTMREWTMQEWSNACENVLRIS